jgi:beta-lactam-binding protein with PASTA domain
VVVSSGHAPVKVPDVAKKPFADAAKALTAAHFSVKRAPTDDFSPTVKRGDVIGTDPGKGASAPFGSIVTVHVSKGPDLVLVPDVTFETIEQATTDLAAAGLQVGTVANYRPGGVVMTQDPTGGTDKKVTRNSQVDLVLSQNGRGR